MGLFDFFKNKSKKETQNTQPNVNVVVKCTTQPQLEEIPSLESRIKNCVPSKKGLYPHEILMLSYAHTFKQANNSFQGFWKYNYSVLDPQSVLNSLAKRGFIVLDDITGTISKLKVNELKELLKNANEKTTGKKEELISRLISCYGSDTLEKMFPERYYKLTTLGEEEVTQNEYVYYLHQHSYMSVWEMNRKLLAENPQHLSYRDIIWGDFNKQSLEFFKDYNFGLYRNVHLSMHDFLLEEKRFNSALSQLVEVASFDLSGLGNSEKTIISGILSPKEIIESKLVDFFFDDDNKEAILPPGIIKYFHNLKNALQMSDSDFVNKIYEEFASVEIRNRIFTSDECANILLSLMGIENRKLKNSYAIAEQRIKELYIK